jgi:hypothetical protein
MRRKGSKTNPRVVRSAAARANNKPAADAVNANTIRPSAPIAALKHRSLSNPQAFVLFIAGIVTKAFKDKKAKVGFFILYNSGSTGGAAEATEQKIKSAKNRRRSFAGAFFAD